MIKIIIVSKTAKDYLGCQTLIYQDLAWILVRVKRNSAC